MTTSWSVTHGFLPVGMLVRVFKVRFHYRLYEGINPVGNFLLNLSLQECSNRYCCEGTTQAWTSCSSIPQIWHTILLEIWACGGCSGDTAIPEPDFIERRITSPLIIVTFKFSSNQKNWKPVFLHNDWYPNILRPVLFNWWRCMAFNLRIMTVSVCL